MPITIPIIAKNGAKSTVQVKDPVMNLPHPIPKPHRQVWAWGRPTVVPVSRTIGVATLPPAVLAVRPPPFHGHPRVVVTEDPMPVTSRTRVKH